jgi:hypothetical protein
MFDHAQTESSLKQLKARSIVIVYQILCQSLLRRAWQGADSHRGRRAEPRLAVPTQQAPLGWNCARDRPEPLGWLDVRHVQFEETAGGRLRLCSCFSKRISVRPGPRYLHGVHLDL